MVTTTTVYSFQKPDVSGDQDAWGGYLNANVDKYESILTGNTTITSLVITTADINGGTLDNVVIGGSTAAAITGTTITGTSLVGPLATAAQPNITSLGTLTTLTVDDITINGSTISDAGDLTFDVGGDLIIDVDGADVKFKDGGTEFAHLFKSGNNFGIYSAISDGDIQFIGVDGVLGQVTALTLDMSDAGTATFNHDIKLGDNNKALFGASSDLEVYHNGTNSVIYDNGTGNLQLVSGGASVDIIKAGGENMANFATDGAVTLYYDNAAKIATSSTGISVSGTVTADGLTVDKTDTGTYSSTAVDDTLLITRKNSSGTNNQVVGMQFNVTQASGVTTGVAGISAVQPTNVSSADLVFQTRNAGTIGERLRITSDGSVGIGTSSPSVALEVNGGTDNEPIKVVSTDAGSYISVADNGTTGSTRFGAVSNDFKIDVNSSERLRINSSGNVGIGNSNPSDYNSNGNNLVVGSISGNNGISIASATTGLGSIYFSDSETSGVGQYRGIVQYDHASDYMRFFTTSAERLRIASDGSVGIGNSNPSDYSSNANNLVVGTTSGHNGITISSGTDSYGSIYFSDGTSGVSQYRGIVQYIHSQEQMRFYTNAAQRMVIDSSGQVGIGTSSPSRDLYISGGSGSRADVQLSYDALGTSAGDGVQLGIQASGGYIWNFENSSLYFATNNAERMRIDSSGSFFVNSTSAATGPSLGMVNARSGTNKNAFVASVEQAGYTAYAVSGVTNDLAMWIYNRTTSNNVGSIRINASSTSYLTSSDHRLKENVVELTGATARLKQLDPKRFNFIADADRTVDGFLAHEVQSVVPEAITGTHNEVDADGNPVYQGIDQSKLVPLLVATIKELEARITALEGV